MDCATWGGEGCASALALRDLLALIPYAAALALAPVPVWVLAIFAAVLGAVAASFSGLLVDRLPRIRGWHGDPDPELSLSRPRSRCDGCGAQVPALALVPVAGWMFAGGRCAGCGEGVPWRYPAIEAATAVASAGAVLWAGPTAWAAASLLLLWVLTAASWIDWRHHEIPDMLTVPLGAAGLIASPFAYDAWDRAAGAIVCAGMVALAFKLTGRMRRVDAMSYGDVALAAALGAWIGACGALPFLLSASVVYVAYAAPRRMDGEVWVPMGPALAIGFALVWVFGLRF